MTATRVEPRMIETFNTHLMSDEVVQALATGREQELAAIIPAISKAAAAPDSPPPALIVYGERGSGKSFLMRLVQMACATLPDVACVLLPEEQYNLRSPHQLLQIVSSQLRGEDWASMGWQFDSRSDEDAWSEELQALHAALDSRFGAGKGMVLVLLENFDTLVEKLFGATPPAKGAARSAALARRQAEERLRKLMNARHGRFMLLASATGTVDMDYERPLFQAFTSVDIQSWSADDAISYFNKRRNLYQQAPLSPAQEARARAIIEFIGGNARLAQLLGSVLSSSSARSISATLDELSDYLADYYRQRLDALPPAAAAVLDSLIRGGEPVSQTGLAQSMKGEQRQIADAFSFLTRSRLLYASTELGGSSQLYRVRDRLFVHFYRRRYGKVSGLGAISELLERFFTPDEREQQIRDHLLHGEFEDARAFGRLPLEGGGIESGFCQFRDNGITDGPPHFWFELADVSDNEVEALRQQLAQQPDHACKNWLERAANAATPLIGTAAQALAAVAASRNRHDQLAQHLLEDNIRNARDHQNTDALIIALDAMSDFSYQRPQNQDYGHALSAELDDTIIQQTSHAKHPLAKAVAVFAACWVAITKMNYIESETLAQSGLNMNLPPKLTIHLSYFLAWALEQQKKFDLALKANEETLSLARQHNSVERQILALRGIARILNQTNRTEAGLAAAESALDLTIQLSAHRLHADLLYDISIIRNSLTDVAGALIAARQAQAIALACDPPYWYRAGCSAAYAGAILLDQQKHTDAVPELLAALKFASHCHDKALLSHIIDELTFVATYAPLNEAITALGQALDKDKDLTFWDSGDGVYAQWLQAVARAQAWEAAAALVQRHPFMLEPSKSSWSGVWDIAAKVWNETAQNQGRATAYANASMALTHIKALFELRPVDTDKTREQQTRSELQNLSAALCQHCSEAGLLRDLADLLQSLFGDISDLAATHLRQFADLHAAPDKERYLQHIDPDLAIAMRRIWNLPEPVDSLGKRGRRRAR